MSVVVCFLDEQRFLDGAIETVRAQTVQDWELLLVDDGSTDGSAAIAERHAATDPRMKILRHPGGGNRGLPASRNLGLTEARGEFLAFLDADDRWDPAKLELQVDEFRSRPAVLMTCGASWYQEMDTGEAPRRVPVARNAPTTFPRGTFVRGLLARDVWPPPPSDVLYRTQGLRAAGGIPDGDNLFEDQRTFVMVNLRGPVHVSDTVLSTYAVRADSLYGSLERAGALRRRQRRTFERWVLRSAIRAGWAGRALAVAVVTDLLTKRSVKRARRARRSAARLVSGRGR